MKKKKATPALSTHLVVLLDRSGSMEPIKQDMIGGFNNFIKTQQKVKGECTVSLARFDSEYEKMHSFISVADLPPLDENNFVPRGSTALIDSMYKLIQEESELLQKKNAGKRPEKILCIVVTDGHENASREIKNDVLKKLIKEKEAAKWEFVYIGANQDSFAVAGNFGVTNAMNYNANSGSVTRAFASMSTSTVRYRAASADSAFSLTKEEQEASAKIKK